uniref:Uncharacterized protein n=1 Tax=Avena sativa TaxID=4498 RepID=A0ACD5W0U6_AVESA
MQVGDGATTLFWVDRWLEGKTIEETAPELFALIPKRARKRRTVREALLERHWITDIRGAPSPLALWQYVQLWIRLRDFELADAPDSLHWRWTTDALRVPLPGIHHLEILEVELACLGTPSSQVLHMACIPTPLLDG